MDLPAVETLTRPKTPSPASAVADKLNSVQRIGMRMLLLGMTPENFNGRNPTRFLLWLTLALVHTAYATYEAVLSIFYARNLLETVIHSYITTYLYAFNIQWFYMLLILPKMHSDPIQIENFHCSKSRPESSEKIVNDNTKFLNKVLTFSIGWWSTNNFTHIVVPAIEAVITYFRYGQVNDVFVLPQVFQFPLWGQVVMYFYSGVTTFGLLVYCASSYAVMGVQVVKIKSLCEILKDALTNASDPNDVRGCIRDHVELIKRTKELNNQLAILNGFMFAACYLDLATQMFVMTLFDPNGSYYVAVAFDLLSIFLILTLQCFMGSQLTQSLESIAGGAYDSNWYDKDKPQSRYVQLVTQMAQKPFEQFIWFGSVKVERATTLNLLRSSYAAYTLLMIFQKE